MRATTLLSALACTLATACIDRTIAQVEPDPNKEERVTFPVEINRDVDILFVIDDSNSMTAEQTELADHFRLMIEELEGLEGGLPNVHIGVVSTDLGAGPWDLGNCSGSGENGQLQNTPRIAGCTPPNGAYIVDVENDSGDRDRNYTGELSDTFACIAKLGTSGCGFEQPLEAMRRALNGSNPFNQGFLREHAKLAVIFLTDEDDCSAEDTGLFAPADPNLGDRRSFRCFEYGIQCEGPDDPRELGPRENCAPMGDSAYLYENEEYLAFLNSLKRNPDRDVLVSAIVADTTPVNVVLDSQGYVSVEPTCRLAGDDEAGAKPPIRLQAFVEQFALSRTESICSADLSQAIRSIGEFIVDGIRSSCLLANLSDTDPDTEGVQPECTVEEIRYPGTPDETRQTLPVCDNRADPDASSHLPCYLLTENLEECADTDTHLSVSVHYAGSDNRPPDTEIDARCLVE